MVLLVLHCVTVFSGNFLSFLPKMICSLSERIVYCGLSSLTIELCITVLPMFSTYRGSLLQSHGTTTGRIRLNWRWLDLQDNYLTTRCSLKALRFRFQVNKFGQAIVIQLYSCTREEMQRSL